MMSNIEKYNLQIIAVKQECPDSDENEVAEEFRRYEEEFLIPPEDALRSVIRKFLLATGKEESNFSMPQKVEKKVNRFSELGSDDKNITIEVFVASYTPRIQMIRGEEKQIAYGWIEDNPWEEVSNRERWDFKDWGQHSSQLAPNSIVRLEGVSVNEWNGKKSININRSTRVTTLREGESTSVQISNEPSTIAKISENEGFGSTIGRIISVKADVIVKKDGSGTLDIFRGKIADSSGSIGFLSWVPFDFKQGELIKLNNISVRKFRDTPEINISNDAKIELYRDNNFSSLEDLSQITKSNISDLRNGMRDISITLQIITWEQRTFTSEDGVERIVRSGDVIDPTGMCRLTAWCDFNPKGGDYIHLTGTRAQFWQGSPDLVVDDIDQIEQVTNAPWEDIDPSNHWVEVDFDELSNGGSRRGIRTSALIVSVRKDSGIIHRCSNCRRVLRDDACAEHGIVDGVEDLRLRFVLDSGVSNASLLLSKGPSEVFLKNTFEEIKAQISTSGSDGFIASLRNSLLSRKVEVEGRALIDDQGTMILAERMEINQSPISDSANNVMEKWGLEI
jgi:ssDNA-binding replication factor A large subunit